MPSLEDILDIRYQWPILKPGTESRYFSSFDRTGANDDGFSGTYSTLYVDERGEQVLFDVEGPGCLRTLWFTSDSGGYANLSLGTLRFYFDGEEKPRIEIDANELYSGKVSPFLAPLAVNNHISTGGFPCWVSLPFNESLKITSENRAFFYISQYDIYPKDEQVDSWTPRLGMGSLAEAFNEALAPLQTVKTQTAQNSLTLSESGVIDSLTFTPFKALTKSDLQSARIRIWWDGQAEPGVDCPLGAFFGTGLGEVPVNAIGFRIEKGVYVNRFPMPFWKSAKIEVTGVEGEVAVQVSPQRYIPTTAGYFAATYNKEHPTTIGKDFTMLKADGAGKLVGTVLVIEPPAPSDKHWWEGDLRSYTNGKRTPGLHGTGHEDDHLGGWSNEFLETPYSLPMHGEPAVEMLDHTSPYNGNCSLYRLWPGLNFVDGIQHSVEHGTENTHNFNYSSVTFWYRHLNWSVVESDSVLVCDAQSRESHNLKSQNESDPVELTSTFEGCEYQKEVVFTHCTHLNAMSFTLKLDASNSGVLLRRVYDQFHGRQRARVLVDGVCVGTWYAPEENRHSRWAERDFFLPASFTKGKETIEVEIDPIAGTPLWSVAEYRAIRLKVG
jgi:hypothetical protein